MPRLQERRGFPIRAENKYLTHAEPESQPAPPPKSAFLLDSESLRVVLFGMPDAGKTSLLGALVQASHLHDNILRARLLDSSMRLGELWRRLYEGQQRETVEEIVAYPVALDFADGERLPVVLYDCDGRIANDLLRGRKELDANAPAGSLTQAVLSADALILAVDASAPADQLETDFLECVRFIHLLQDDRSRRQDVGGLPVFLTLTKCDRLALEDRRTGELGDQGTGGPGPITQEQWEAYIDDRKLHVAERFSDFLEGRAGEQAPLAFGSVELHVCATSVRQPALADIPARPKEPFGVAELFRDCFQSASAYRKRTLRSSRLLGWILTGLAGVLSLMSGGIVYFAEGGPQPGQVSPLMSKIEAYEDSEGPASSRLAANVLRSHYAELAAFRDAPDFYTLPDWLQAFVLGRLEEIKAYEKLRDQLRKIPSLAGVSSLEELKEARQRLNKTAPIPQAYESEWADTEAVLDREQYVIQIRQLEEAVALLTSFYQALQNDANALWLAAKLDAEWSQSFRQLLDQAGKPPFTQADPAKGPAYGFAEVEVEKQGWNMAFDRLKRFEQIAEALGFIDDTTKKGVLMWPPGTPPAELNRTAAGRLQALKQQYPAYADWSSALIPDPSRGVIEEKLKAELNAAILDGRQAIAEKIKGLSLEKSEDRKKLADWLSGSELKEYREYTGFLHKLLSGKPADAPVEALVKFLQRETFELEIQSVRLTIPESLKAARLKPAEVLGSGETMDHTPVFKIYYQPGGVKKNEIEFILTLDRKDEPPGQAFGYTYTAKDTLRISFHPGDNLFAAVDLDEGTRRWRLTWDQSKCAAYRFESLLKPPTLHAPDQPVDKGQARTVGQTGGRQRTPYNSSSAP